MGNQILSKKKYNQGVLNELLKKRQIHRLDENERFFYRSESLGNNYFVIEKTQLKHRVQLNLLMKLLTENSTENDYLQDNFYENNCDKQISDISNIELKKPDIFSLTMPFDMNSDGLIFMKPKNYENQIMFEKLLELTNKQVFLEKKHLENCLSKVSNKFLPKLEVPLEYQEKNIQEQVAKKVKIGYGKRIKNYFKHILVNLREFKSIKKSIKVQKKVFFKQKNDKEKEIFIEKEKIANIWRILEKRAELLKEQYRVKEGTDKLLDKIQKYMIEKLTAINKELRNLDDAKRQKEIEEDMEFKFRSGERKKIDSIQKNEYLGLRKLTDERQKFEKEKLEFQKKMEMEKWEISEQWKELLKERSKIFRKNNEKLQKEFKSFKNKHDFINTKISKKNKKNIIRINCNQCGLKLPEGGTFCPKCGLDKVSNMLKLTQKLGNDRVTK